MNNFGEKKTQYSSKQWEQVFLTHIFLCFFKKFHTLVHAVVVFADWIRGMVSKGSVPHRFFPLWFQLGFSVLLWISVAFSGFSVLSSLLAMRKSFGLALVLDPSASGDAAGWNRNLILCNFPGPNTSCMDDGTETCYNISFLSQESSF